MQQLEWKTIDKSEWADGPWQREPDKEQWEDERTGLVCLIKRNPSLGNLCGYVGIDESHPLYGEQIEETDFDVHGGITYSDFCQEGDEAETICHVPNPGEPEPLFWLGFDAAHFMDMCPAYDSRHGDCASEFDDVYRDREYMRQQCADLAQQLAQYST